MSWPARYPGTCVECLERFDFKDLIEATETEQGDTGYAHDECVGKEPDLEPKPTCGVCHMVLPVTGECGWCE